MPFLQDFLDRSKQLNQTLTESPKHAYQLQNHKYKIIHQALIIPNLPPPLHYFNFFSLIGQPNIPILNNPNAISSDALDTAVVMSSVSAHMVGQFNTYSIQKECEFNQHGFHFLNREQLLGTFPNFKFKRHDAELSVDLNITTTDTVSCLTRLRFSVVEHWSILCKCQGQIQYQDHIYPIDSLASFEFARSIYFSHVPLAFFTYQVMNISRQRQILLRHIRDSFNRVIQSRIYLRDLNTNKTECFDQQVFFKVHRVYPSVTTPNLQKMYLAREFEWCYESEQGTRIWVQAQSRGDYKFGVGAGYAGSFHYQIKINDETEIGESGYIEYIDCRPLRFQEQDKTEKLLNHLANPVPFMLKK